MPNEQLLAYIRSEFAKGISRNDVVRSTLSAGWKVSDINVAIAAIDGSPLPNLVPAPAVHEPSYAPVSSSPVASVYQPEPTAIPLSQKISIQPTMPEIKYASFWLRMAAVMVDSTILLALLTATVFSGSNSLIIAMYVSMYVYYVFMTGQYQATLGKMALGIHVERVNGEKIGFGRAFLREILGKFVSSLTLFIGYLMVFWTQKKQGLHDKIADTVVIENDPSKSKKVWIIGTIIVAVALPVIFIVSSVFLASLNAARMKGNDAAIKADLSMIQAQAEIYYGENNSYSTAVSCAEGMFASDTVEATSVSSLDTKDGNATVCVSKGENYMIVAPISDGWWCVDSTGTNGTVTKLPAAGTYACQSSTGTASSSPISSDLTGNEIISGTTRDNFVQGVMQSCDDSMKGEKTFSRLSSATITSYCSCISNKIANNITNAQITEIDNLPKDAPLPTYVNEYQIQAGKACSSILK